MVKPSARLILAMAACAVLGAQAPAADSIDYFECRADNDAAESVFALDNTTKKVCDRASGNTWIEPTAFGPEKVVWNDAYSTKTIYRKGKNKGYEHDILLFVHIGRCSRLKTPPALACRN